MKRASALLLSTVLAQVALGVPAPGQATVSSGAVEDHECGLAARLPWAKWQRKDAGRSGVVVNIYSPKWPPMPRVTLMRFPRVFLLKGMETRASQVENAGAIRRRLEPATLAGRAATVYEYTARGSRAVEYGLPTGDAFYIVQVAASEEDWKDADQRAAFEAVFKSIRLIDRGGSAPELRVDPKSPDQVRAARTKSRPETPAYSIREHDVVVRIEPAEKSLTVTDDLVVESRIPGLEMIMLHCSHVQVDRITTGGDPLTWRRKGGTQLIVRLPRALAKEERVDLRFEAHCDDYNLAEDQKLVEEIAVFGQVGIDSSYSSHVLFYPIDERNDASVRLALDVPDGYTAVSGGELVDVRASDGRRTFRYEGAIRTPRQLPFGFAVGRYERLSGRGARGLAIDVYYLDGKKEEARQRLKFTLDGADYFEETMGPLPWRRVAFCHVKPRTKAMGVSLPGLVLFSDEFIRDASTVRLSGASVTAADDLGLLLFVDELSHQWNFYAVPLPNEFAEGVSTFTNLLCIERSAGKEEYVKGVRNCAEMYLASATGEEDVAVADPRLYRSRMYRTVAFCKVPAALAQLRVRLGDRSFFPAWRTAFTRLKGDRGSYRAFVEAMSGAVRRDLTFFFDQWFFQAGQPRLAVSWSSSREDGRARLRLAVEQTQPVGVYDLELPLAAVGVSGKALPFPPLRIVKKQQEITIDVPERIQAVRLDPEGLFPLVTVTVREKGGGRRDQG